MTRWEKVGIVFIGLLVIGIVAVPIASKMDNVPLSVYMVCGGLPILAALYLFIRS